MEEYTTNRYKMIGKIGEGVHGYVIKAIDLNTNKEVAIKKVPLRNKHGNISLTTVREIKVLQHSSCEYIIGLNEIFPDLVGLSLVFDYMPYTLYGKLKSENNPMSRQEVKKYSSMMFKGITYLHSLKIMHRDIKPANLLISENGVLKLADFGLARIYDKEDPEKLYSPQVATRWYRAPEILWGSQKYGPAIDIWAGGCVLAEMLRGVPLFAGTTDIEQLALVIRTLGTPNAVEWPELRSLPDFNKIRFPYSKGENWENLFPSCTGANEIDLVTKLIRYNPKYRLTGEQAVQHKYHNDAE
ncbi:cyclin-dependent kinase 20 isoform X2 [Condylostylus longicornis]|uniref:cyclin-dependent kinase 20 isoform X2 n=1 Tax=Condylostylus longicornis TaxID=2530218 RepID=UPI00244DB5D0|nr:cyclin-dependent kinase 20 isoform X2 [Condylostylus longicornis]